MSSNAEFNAVFTLPVMALEYRDLASAPISNGAAKPPLGVRPQNGEDKGRADVELSNEEFAERIIRERADATLQAEQRLRQEYEQKLHTERAAIATAIDRKSVV